MVSFFIVNNVVAQGKWQREKIKKFIAVKIVQLLFIKRSFKLSKDSYSTSIEPLVYNKSNIGITISFAGIPNKKASKPKSLLALTKIITQIYLKLISKLLGPSIHLPSIVKREP